MIQGISKRIKCIKFAFLSPDEIRNMSATKVITADTYDDDGYPMDTGLMDPRMGVIEPGLRCKTCGGKVDECQGHFGHIEFAMPIIHVGYVKDIKRFLQWTCKKCGRLLLSKEEREAYKDVIESFEKLGEIDVSTIPKEIVKDIASRGVCSYCGEPQGKITLDKPTTFRENGEKLTPKQVRERLERIPDEDLILIGINPKVVRPEWLVLTALPVPPVTVRPSITLDSGERSEDDLTHKLVDVLRINHRLRENRDGGAPQLIVEDLWELLQYHTTTYFDNQTSGIPPARHRSGRPLKTLVQRLKGKEGRFRSNLSGKRVNFSSRTVISPDPLLSINEVGVPISAARELTVPIHVTPHNLTVVKEFVRRGNTPLSEDGRYVPGVNYVIRPDGYRIKITEKNAQTIADNLDIGYIVERQLAEGDIVLFNRQPSLHRMSMMSHEARIMPFKTFRLNLAVCPPYNADFDGDEMNLHVPQSNEARAEARILMRVQEHVLSPRFGGPIIGGIHDHITGCFMLTHKDSKFDKEEMAYIGSILEWASFPEPDLKEKDTPYWSGKLLFSLTLPQNLNMEFRAAICQRCAACAKDKCPIDAYVIIKNGKLICGTIDGKAIGAFRGKIIDILARDYGSDVVRKFIDTFTKLAIGVLSLRGFTTGIDDGDIPEDATIQIKEILKVAKNRVNELVSAYRDELLEQLPGRTLEETLEVEVMKVLGKARDDAGAIAGKFLGLEKPSVIMAITGARGSMLNLSQMSGSIGQQAVRGERITRGYSDRTLPHFKKNELGAEARGFVEASYKSGMSPVEYFFHGMGGREGLVDTAVRTSRSGYMQRRLINALEDLKVREDHTVRNTADTVIQFRYGEDCIDPSRSVQGDAIDVDSIFREVLREEGEVDLLSKIEMKEKEERIEYGIIEKEEFETEGEVEVEEEFEEEYEEE